MQNGDPKSVITPGQSARCTLMQEYGKNFSFEEPLDPEVRRKKRQDFAYLYDFFSKRATYQVK